MSNSIKFKKSCTINEQINLLKAKNLNIKNEQLLIFYLKRYNYQNFINGYNDFLFVNNQRTSDKYKDNVTELEIIQLFNFDRAISSLILNNILDIERMLSSYITTILCETLSINNINKYGQILNLSDEQYQLIFSNAIYQNKRLSTSEIKDHLYKSFEKHKNENLIKKYEENNNVIPIWVISIFWSFGDLVKFIKWLSNFQIQKIIKLLPIPFQTMNIQIFLEIIDIMKKIRNRCCHNNIIYNFHAKISYQARKYFDIKTNKIRIYDIIKLLDIFKNKQNNQENSLRKCIDQKINLYLKKNKINQDIITQILKYMHFNNK